MGWDDDAPAGGSGGGWGANDEAVATIPDEFQPIIKRRKSVETAIYERPELAVRGIAPVDSSELSAIDKSLDAKPFDKYDKVGVVDPEYSGTATYDTLNEKPIPLPTFKGGSVQLSPEERVLASVAFHEKHKDSASSQRTKGLLTRIPFLNVAEPVGDFILAKNAANRIEKGTATDADYLIIGKHLVEADRAAEKAKALGKADLFSSERGEQVMELMSHLPTFAMEMAVTRGAYSGPKKLLEQGILRTLKSSMSRAAFKGVAQNTVGKVALRGAVQAPAAIAANAPQAVVNAQLWGGEAARRMVDDIHVERDKNGDLRFRDDKTTFIAAVPQGMLDAYIEVASEKTGGLVPWAGKMVGIDKLGKAAVAKLAMGELVERFAKAKGMPVAQAIKSLSNRADFNGIPGEIFEERLGETARYATGLTPNAGTAGDLASGDWKRFWRGTKQVLTETAGFAPMAGAGPAMGVVQDYADGRARTAQILQWGEGDISEWAAANPAKAAQLATLDTPSRSQWSDFGPSGLKADADYRSKFAATVKAHLATNPATEAPQPTGEQVPAEQPQQPAPQAPGSTLPASEPEAAPEVEQAPVGQPESVDSVLGQVEAPDTSVAEVLGEQPQEFADSMIGTIGDIAEDILGSGALKTDELAMVQGAWGRLRRVAADMGSSEAGILKAAHPDYNANEIRKDMQIIRDFQETVQQRYAGESEPATRDSLQTRWTALNAQINDFYNKGWSDSRIERERAPIDAEMVQIEQQLKALDRPGETLTTKRFDLGAKTPPATVDPAQPTPGVEAEQPARQIWEMQQAEYVDGHIKSPGIHREIVRQAIEAGKPVPASVLAEYPELAPKSAPSKGLKPEVAWIRQHLPSAKVVGKKNLNPLQAKVSQWLDSFRVKHTFVDHEGEFTAFTNPETKHVYLSAKAKSEAELFRLAGDELGHALGLDMQSGAFTPEQIEWAANDYLRRADKGNEKQKAYGAQLRADPERLKREAVSHLISQAVMNPQFRAELEKEQPSLLQRIIDAIFALFEVRTQAELTDSEKTLLRELRDAKERMGKVETPTGSVADIRSKMLGELDETNRRLDEITKDLGKKKAFLQRGGRKNKAALIQELEDQWKAAKQAHADKRQAIHKRYSEQIESHPDRIAERDATSKRAKEMQAEAAEQDAQRRERADREDWDAVQQRGGYDAVRKDIEAGLAKAKNAHAHTKESNKWKSKGAVERHERELERLDTLREKFATEPQPAEKQEFVLWGRRKGEPWIRLTDNTSNAEMERRKKDGWEVLRQVKGAHPDDIHKAEKPAEPTPEPAAEKPVAKKETGPVRLEGFERTTPAPGTKERESLDANAQAAQQDERDLNKRWSKATSEVNAIPRAHNKKRAAAQQQANDLGKQWKIADTNWNRYRKEYELARIEDYGAEEFKSPLHREAYLVELLQARGQDASAHQHNVRVAIDELVAERTDLNKDERQGVAEQVERGFSHRGSLDESIKFAAARQKDARQGVFKHTKDSINSLSYLTPEQKSDFAARIDALDGADWYKQQQAILEEANNLNEKEKAPALERRRIEGEQAAKAAAERAKQEAIDRRETRRKKAAEPAYWRGVKERAKEVGDKGTVETEEFKDDQGNVRKKKSKTIKVGSYWKIKEYYTADATKKDGLDHGWSITHVPSDKALGAYNKESSAREVFVVLSDLGVNWDVPSEQEIVDNIKSFKQAVAAHEHERMFDLDQEQQDRLLSTAKSKPTTVKADIILDAADLGIGLENAVQKWAADQKGTGFVFRLAKELAEFRYNPVFTADGNGGLVFRDGYKYTVPAENFDLLGLEEGTTVGINLEDIGIERATEQDVVAEAFDNQAFMGVKKAKDGTVTATWKGGKVTLTRLSEGVWESSGSPNVIGRANQTLERIRWVQPGQDAPSKGKAGPPVGQMKQAESYSPAPTQPTPAPAKKGRKKAEPSPESDRIARKFAKGVVEQIGRNGFAVEPEGFTEAYSKLEDADKLSVVKVLKEIGLISPVTAKQKKPPVPRSLSDEVIGQAKRQLEDHKAVATNRHVPFTDSEFYKKATDSEPLHAAPVDDGPLFAAPAEQWRSNVLDSLDAWPQSKGSPQQVLAHLAKTAGAMDEAKFIGLDDYLKRGKASYTKQELREFVEQHRVEVEEVTLGEQGSEDHPSLVDVHGVVLGSTHSDDYEDPDGLLMIAEQSGWEAPEGLWLDESFINAIRFLRKATSVRRAVSPTHFAQYVLPGGENYRERFVTLPLSDELIKANERLTALRSELIELVREDDFGGHDGPRGALEELAVWKGVGNEYSPETLAKAEEWRAARKAVAESNWNDGHGQYESIKNPVVRLRTNERTTSDGKRVLFIEEMQPPSKENQKKMPEWALKRWREIGMKQAIRLAAQEGLDGIAWTPGTVQAERYSLEKQVQKVQWGPVKEGRKRVRIEANGRQAFVFEVKSDGTVFNPDGPSTSAGWGGKQLDEVIGKEVAKKIIGDEGGELAGDGLKIGGEGLKKAYDSDLPNVANKLAKKFGAKVGEGKIATSTRQGQYDEHGFAEESKVTPAEVSVPTLLLPDAMKESAAQGMPLFAAPEDLANPMLTPDGRERMDEATQEYSDNKERRPDAVVQAEVDAALAADYQGEVDWLRNWTPITPYRHQGDTQMGIASYIVNRIDNEAHAPGATVDAKLDALHMKLQVRRLRAPWGNQGRWMHDPIQSPGERRAQAIRDAIDEPSPDVSEALKEAGKDITKLKEALKLQMEEAEKLRELLTGMGWNLDAIADMSQSQALNLLDDIGAKRNASWFDSAFEYYRNALLSAPTTHAVNTLSNVMRAGSEFFLRMPFEAFYNVAMGKMLGKEQYSQDAMNFSDLGQVYSHLFDVEEIKKLRAGKVAGALGKSFIEWDHTDSHAILSAIMPRFAEAAHIALVTADTGRSMLDILTGEQSDTEANAYKPAISGTKGRVVRAMGYTPLQMSDQFAKALIAPAVAAGIANRMAKKRGMSGNALQRFIEKQVSDYRSPAWQQAYQRTNEITFTQTGGAAAQSLKRGWGAFNKLGLRWVTPFSTFTINMIERAVKEGPTGIVPMGLTVYGIYHANQAESAALKEGNIEAARRARAKGDRLRALMPRKVAEQFLAWGAVLALAAIVWGQDDDDPWITGAEGEWNEEQRELARRKGILPMTLRMPGGRRVSYARIEPMATILPVVIDWANGVKSGDPKKMMLNPVKSIIGQAKTKTFLAGVGDILKIAEAEDTYEGAAIWASNFTAGWIPNNLRVTGRAKPDIYRERGVWGDGSDWWLRLGARTVQKTELLESAEALGVPLPDSLVGEVGYDTWGRPRKRGTSPVPGTDFLYRAMSPIETRVPDVFIADKALAAWNRLHPYDQERTQFMPMRFFKNKSGKNQHFTDSQYEEFVRISGGIAAELIKESNINGDNPSESDIEAIKDSINDARSITRDTLAPVWERGESTPPEPVIRDLKAKVAEKQAESHARALAESYPISITAKEKKEGVTIKMKQDRWRDRMTKSIKWMHARSFTPDRAVRLYKNGSNEAKARIRRRMAGNLPK